TCSTARCRRSLPAEFDTVGRRNRRALRANPVRSKDKSNTREQDVRRRFSECPLLSGRLRTSCAEMKPHFRAISAALHPPELNWHLTKSRLNDAPPLCEMQRCESCLALHQEDKVDFSWARVDE